MLHPAQKNSVFATISIEVFYYKCCDQSKIINKNELALLCRSWKRVNSQWIENIWSVLVLPSLLSQQIYLYLDSKSIPLGQWISRTTASAGKMLD